ncbi:MAG: thymidine kinase [Bacteroidales bacterium]|nr:thymidine kinase [Bacteroidales bacterium]
MFLEQKPNEYKKRGWIEVICGSMFSGKTEELIRRLNRARIAKLRIELFKPAIDVRYSVEEIVSHDEKAMIATPVDNAISILLYVGDNVDVVGIDEAQFFNDDLVDVCNQLANRGIRVIVAGLDMDYLGKPFGPMPQLLAIAEYVTKLHAICVKCGNLAQFSHRKVKNENLILLGEAEEYEPLCRECYNSVTAIN